MCSSPKAPISGGIFRRILGGEQGSVLTEFLIVAPLYLIMLGGLLLSNDMLRIKNKILMLDSFITVTGTHRYMRSDGNAITKQVNGVWGDFMPKSINAPLMLANEYVSNNGKNLSNNWNAVYAGRIDVEYTLPWLVTSLMSVQRIVFGDKKYSAVPQSFRFYADPGTGAFPGENECRFHVIQRHWTGKGGDKEYNRIESAAKLISNGIMTNVLQDAWLFAENVQGTSSVEGNDATYKQQLAKYAE